MSQRPSYLQRNAGNWYVHSNGGYINENQILGAGSGWGNDVQTFALSFNKGWNKYGIKFQHISHNPTEVTNVLSGYGGAANWEDFSYGIIINQRFKNILFNLNMEWVNSKNYLWDDNRKASNTFLFFNAIYLW